MKTNQSKINEWESCLSALKNSEQDSEVIQAATRWIKAIRTAIPQFKPTAILPEPAGGLIIKRQHKDETFELTIYNNHTTEFCYYLDNKIINMFEIPSSISDLFFIEESIDKEIQ